MAEDVELGNVRKKAKLDHSPEFSSEYASADRETGNSSSIRLNDIDLNGQRNAEESGRTDEEIPDTLKSSSNVIQYESSAGSCNDSDDSSSDTSDLSDLSSMSGHTWKATAGPLSWVQKMMEEEKDPRTILNSLMSDEDLDEITGFPDFMLWKLIIQILSEPPKRKKLDHINTIEDVVELMKTCNKIIVLTGAGVSVSCGIPDFRSRDGVYARLAVDFPDLPDPQAMFDIRYFRNDQRPFFKFAKEIYPGQFEPSKAHKFIHTIEQHGKLLRNYTQNIDTLEQQANIHNVIQCHGSFAMATCMCCGFQVDADYIKEDIMNQVIPRCPKCVVKETSVEPNKETDPEILASQSDPVEPNKETDPKVLATQSDPVEANKETDPEVLASQSDPVEPTTDITKLNVLKPDIVFFGESLPEKFHNQMTSDKDVCDLLIVIGSSLKVRPVALIPNSLPAHIPQVLINREPLKHLNFDVELLGNCDVIVSEMCRRLGPDWYLCGDPPPLLQQLDPGSLPTPPTSPSAVFRHHSQCHCPSNTAGCRIVDENHHLTDNDTKENDHKVGEACASQDIMKCDNNTRSITDIQSHDDLQAKQSDPLVDSNHVQLIKNSSSVGSDFDTTSRVNNVSMHVREQVSEEEPCISEPPNEEMRLDVAVDKSSTTNVIDDHSKEDSLTKGEPAQGSSGSTTDSMGTEEMKLFWKPRLNLASGLSKSQFLFKPPCRYVFHGAEVLVPPDSSSDEEDGDIDHSGYSEADVTAMMQTSSGPEIQSEPVSPDRETTLLQL